MSKVVLDTNVLVSALIKKEGKPAQIVRHLDEVALVTAEELLAELEEVLHRRHIQHKYHLSDADIDEYLARLRMASTLVQLQTRVDVVIDPDDNMLVACALDGEQPILSAAILTFSTFTRMRGYISSHQRRFLRCCNEQTASSGHEKPGESRPTATELAILTCKPR